MQTLVWQWLVMVYRKQLINSGKRVCTSLYTLKTNTDSRRVDIKVPILMWIVLYMICRQSVRILRLYGHIQSNWYCNDNLKKAPAHDFESRWCFIIEQSVRLNVTLVMYQISLSTVSSFECLWCWIRFLDSFLFVFVLLYLNLKICDLGIIDICFSLKHMP